MNGPQQQPQAPLPHGSWSPQQHYPQQGCPQPGYPLPFGAPLRRRANAVASVLAGLLALLTAGLLVWFAVANIPANNTPEPWPSVVRMNVIGGFVAAAWLLIAALLTFARTVPGAWTLSATSLFFAIMITVLSPLLRGQSVGAQLDFVFGFHKATGVAIGLTTIVATLTAIVAAVAAIAKQP